MNTNNLQQGEIIRQARKKAGLTAKELAEIIGVTPSAITQWEKGNTGIAEYRLLQLSQKLSFKLMDFYKANGPTKKPKLQSPILSNDWKDSIIKSIDSISHKQESVKTLANNLIFDFGRLNNKQQSEFLRLFLQSLKKEQRKIVVKIMTEWITK